MTRWSHASIRVRLTGWYSVVLILMLVVYATATFVAVRHEFHEQFDDQLHDDFETAEGALTAAADARVTWSGDRHHDPDAEDRAIEVWSATGGLMYRSDDAPALPPVVPAAAAARSQYESVTAGDHHWRMLTTATMVGGRSVVLRVSRSEDRL